MPAPLVALLWVAGTLLLGGGGALAVRELLFRLKGKRLAVLGERQVGKTVLSQFMTGGTVPLDYRQTVMPEALRRNRLRLRDLELRVNRSRDVGGDKANYGLWKDLHDEADVVLYLLRADKLIGGDAATRRRVSDDLTHLKKWRDAKRKGGAEPPVLVVIGTHCDLDPEFEAMRHDRAGEYLDRFRARPELQRVWALAGGAARVPVLLGSLATEPDREAVVYALLQLLQSPD